MNDSEILEMYKFCANRYNLTRKFYKDLFCGIVDKLGRVEYLCVNVPYNNGRVDLCAIRPNEAEGIVFVTGNDAELSTTDLSLSALNFIAAVVMERFFGVGIE